MFNFMHLFHDRPTINHLIIIKTTNKKFLTCCVLHHVSSFMFFPKFIGRSKILVHIKQCVAHPIQNVSRANVIIIILLIFFMGFNHGLFFPIWWSWSDQGIRLQISKKEVISFFPMDKVPSIEFLKFKKSKVILVKVATIVVRMNSNLKIVGATGGDGFATKEERRHKSPRCV